MKFNWSDITGKDAIDTLEMIFEASVDLETSSDSKGFLDKVLQHSRKIVGATAGSLYLIDEGSLTFLACQNDEINIDEILESKGAIGKKMPLRSSSIAGHVASSGEDIYIADVYAISSKQPFEFNDAVDKQTGFKTQSILALPMRHPIDGIVGTLELINPDEKAVSRMRMGLIKSFSVMAAVSIVNLRLRENLKEAYMETLFRLGVASEYNDEDTYDHIQRIRHSSKIIAEQMGYSTEAQENIFHASAMHDIGKIGVADFLIQKKGRLTDEEMSVMRTHPEIGSSILKDSKTEILQLSESIALCHHEKWDGSGYPHALKGDNIPHVARIVAIADVFDALVNARPYKKAWPLDKALALIREERGAHFDPDVVDAFFEVLPEIKVVQKKYGCLIEN
ncbi:MAG: HD domain-containing phosphohydrolase [Mariprofundaceae bacterium]